MSEKYPGTFDAYYRPRFEHWASLEAEGKRYYNNTLPLLCQVCQIPMLFTEPGDPTKICYRESDYDGEKFHFCSDGCKRIFDHEPEKYVQAWLPVHQIYQGNCFRPEADPTGPDFNPLLEVITWYGMNVGVDNAPYEGSDDQQHFLAWREQQTTN
jgi:phenol hydroxylase P3 protein